MAKGKMRQDDFIFTIFGQGCWANCVRGIFFSSLSPSLLVLWLVFLLKNFNSTLSDFTELLVMWCFAFPMAIRNGGGGTSGMDPSPFCLLY